MLMKLLWTVAEPLLSGFLDVLPDAPEPFDVVIPWPAWLPWEPFAVGLAAMLLVGSAALLVRFLRWVYGLVPVLQ